MENPRAGRVAIAKLRPEILTYKPRGFTEGDANTQERSSQEKSDEIGSLNSGCYLDILKRGMGVLFGYPKKRERGGGKAEKKPPECGLGFCGCCNKMLQTGLLR